MTFPPNDSPFWPILKLGIISTCLTVLLVANASHFDRTEVITLIGTLLTASGLEGLQWKATKRPPKGGTGGGDGT